ncbi:hypothetical protein ZYGR_0I02370 [Zygosaccharomyces rouxii]|uniref:Spindle pole component BBP1 n=2 Tax=Zygosaccharomyces rouxii TaxID=4956 RepID=BBP1_ZYGRC|nr:uncharacterized protein ZYRO0C05632g [Zygosaccharomyces rouxii]C5DT56.1 RecName: Full=Spindle pole component BBP1 [Zygosaccharomyces rouxii CBS 732]KAH9201847.1 spindle pole component BBP1 [Zygosaccharomyces rouxii]GAV47941.1 hypothetical protein ZYGR_0I02370 [Zygosaccharomyces rouxii]CAR26967.1 ZYRO0C05632p [Zygosaccharomyces rouxii]
MSSEQVDENTSGGIHGLYRWTMDALFGSRVSPSRKYREFAQDDTNYKSRDELFKGSYKDGNSRGRSNSWSGLDPNFYRRHDLLPLEESQSSSKSSLMDPVDLHPRAPASPVLDTTDTFGAKKGSWRRSESTIEFKSPSADDPVVSRLFEKRKPRHKENVITQRLAPQIPGKFPSPVKGPSSDYTSEYLEILNQLDRNGRALQEVNRGLWERCEQRQRQEKSYRDSYRETRAELINELKQSRKLYDNYYKLYGKYQQLKAISKETLDLQSKVNNLESELVDTAIKKEKQIHDLHKQLFQAELRAQEAESRRQRDAIAYESRIADLQRQLENRYRPSSPVSYRDQSTLSDYNASVDTQFLKNLV